MTLEPPSCSAAVRRRASCVTRNTGADPERSDAARTSQSLASRRQLPGGTGGDLVKRQAAGALTAASLPAHPEPGVNASVRSSGPLVSLREARACPRYLLFVHKIRLRRCLVQALAQQHGPRLHLDRRVGVALEDPRQRRPLQLDLPVVAVDVDRHERGPVLWHGRHHLIADGGARSGRVGGAGGLAWASCAGRRSASAGRSRTRVCCSPLASGIVFSTPPHHVCHLVAEHPDVLSERTLLDLRDGRHEQQAGVGRDVAAILLYSQEVPLRFIVSFCF